MNPQIAIFLGSDSDFPVFQSAVAFLEDHKIPFVLEVTSAHRTPERTRQLVAECEKNGVKVFIAAAGGAAHLAGVVASHTLLPVLAVPIATQLSGFDSLLSMCQMPAGIPVATFGIGESGAFNAVMFAVQVLAAASADRIEILREFRSRQVEKVEEKSRKLKEKLKGP